MDLDWNVVGAGCVIAALICYGIIQWEKSKDLQDYEPGSETVANDNPPIAKNSQSVPKNNNAFGTTSETLQSVPKRDVEPAPEPEKQTWFSYLVNMDTHIKLIGKTKAGKSTLAQLLLTCRAEMGEICIVTPIVKDEDWGPYRANIVGRGEGYQEIAKFMEAVLAEKRRRTSRQAEGLQNKFERLTIFVDELPLICRHVALAPEFFAAIGESGRHVGIQLVLLSQSNLVKKIGGSIDDRENFITVYLGKHARHIIKRINSELTGQLAKAHLTNPKTARRLRDEIRHNELVSASAYPAVVDDDGEWGVYDRDWVPDLFQHPFKLDGVQYPPAGQARPRFWNWQSHIPPEAIRPASQPAVPNQQQTVPNVGSRFPVPGSQPENTKNTANLNENREPEPGTGNWEPGTKERLVRDLYYAAEWTKSDLVKLLGGRRQDTFAFINQILESDVSTNSKVRKESEV
jgi:hypothetical protein